MSETATIPTEFDKMLSKFHRIIENEPPVKDVKEQLEKLSEFAKNSKQLNSRQMDAIMARCHNYIIGDYGVNRKKDAFNKEHKL